MLGLKVSAILAACIYMVAGARPPSRHVASSSRPASDLPDCPDGQWFWEAKHICLPRLESAPEPILNPPNGGICRQKTYWHVNGYCAPLSPSDRPRYCPKGYHVNPSNFLCERIVVLPQASVTKNQCPKGEWYWAPKHVCLPKLKVSPGPDPHFPNGEICRWGWYWHESGYCAPLSPSKNTYKCPQGYKVNPSNFLCESQLVLPQASVIENQCPKGEWYWAPKHVCLPRSENVSRPTARPPSDSPWKCPAFWYWHRHGHCVPIHANLIEYTCPWGYQWKPTQYYCERNVPTRAFSLFPMPSDIGQP